MKLFGKNKEPEDQEEAKVELRKKRSKKQKDAAWGKKERMIVFLSLSITIGLSTLLALSARSWKLPNLPRMNKLKLASKLPNVGGRTIILEGEENTMLQNKVFEENINSFKEVTKGLSGVYGFYLINLADDFSYGYYQDETFQAASLIKLPVMTALYQKEENGEIDLEKEYKLREDDKVAGSGSLQNQKSGYVVTYQELLKLMGRESDNTAFKIAVNLIGEEKVQEIIFDLGMTNTSYEKNTTTPQDIGLFFKNLYNNKYLDKKHTDEFFSYLTDTIYEDWLAKGIPGDIRVAHKFGREVHVLNDAGVIFSDKRLIMVIMSKGIVEPEANEIFPHLSEKLFEIEEASW